MKSEYEGQLVPYEDFAESLGRFKYLLSVDGVTVAWRARALLQAGGTLLLQNSAMGEHFYDDMIPWTHYVPIKQDLSDLISTVEWLEGHPGRAEEIAAAGFRFAQEKSRSAGRTQLLANSRRRGMGRLPRKCKLR